jgi:hypothetical protein
MKCGATWRSLRKKRGISSNGWQLRRQRASNRSSRKSALERREMRKRGWLSSSVMRRSKLVARYKKLPRRRSSRP